MKVGKHDVDRLIAAALAGQKNAYCPRSRYAVGASVLGASGRVYQGCNVESPTLILHVCAERAAIFNAISHGERRIVAVCTVSAGSFPCGSCRQAIREFGGPRTPIYSMMRGRSAAKPLVAKTTIAKLLPDAHTSDTIERYSP